MNNAITNPVSAYFLSLNSKTTIDSSMFRLRVFCRYAFNTDNFDNCDWHKLTYVTVLEFMQYQQAEGLAHTSINVTLSTIKSVALQAWQLGFIDINEYMRIKSIKNKKGVRADTGRALSFSEIHDLKQHFLSCNSHDMRRNYAIFALACGAGLRRRELSLLNISDIKNGAVTVHGKGNKVRTVYLNDFVIAAVNRWLDVHQGTSKALFVRIFVNGRQGKRLSILSIHRAMEKVVAAASCERFTTHDLRRTFATRLLDLGADMFVVQRLLGHTSINTTEKYDKRGEAALRDTVSLLRF